MAWLLINAATHELLSGPHDDYPEGDGAYAAEMALGWPLTLRWSADARGFVGIAPPAPLSRLAFQKLFTQAERIAIRGSADPAVIDFRELASLAEYVDLADQDVVTGVGYLESMGLIGAGRGDQVLAGDPPG